MNFQIVIKPTATEVATAVCEWMIETIHSAIHERGHCSIALSGGSTPKRLYEWIAENELHCVDWSKVILMWGDERNVPHDHEDSNYGMVRKAWLDRAESTQEPRCIPQVYPVPITSNAPDHIAFEYSQTIRKAMRISGLDTKPTPVIDIVLLGLGDDAHTASIFPDTLAAQPSEDLFMANFVPKLGAYRFTMTPKLINSARRIAFLVCGASKQPAIDMVWHGPREPERYPAQWIQPVHGELLWFIDATAQPERRDP